MFLVLQAVCSRHRNAVGFRSIFTPRLCANKFVLISDVDRSKLAFYIRVEFVLYFYRVCSVYEMGGV